MQGAVITAPDRISPELRERYSLLLDGALP
jgi:hypothetical protein